jgi:hypothetical protein
VKKFIPIILLLCFFTNSCNILKEVQKALESKIASYYIFIDLTIIASRNKTRVEASILYTADRQGFAKKSPSKVEFNGLEMNKSLSKTESEYLPPCGEIPQEKTSSQINEPGLMPQVQRLTPEPTPQEPDFFVVFDGYKTENVITVTDPENKTESYRIVVDPIIIENPESIKFSRSKDTIVQLKGKGSGKIEDLAYFISQDVGKFIDQKDALFNPNDNTIRFPADLIKKLKAGKADFFLSNHIINSIKPQGILSFTFHDDLCVQIIN